MNREAFIAAIDTTVYKAAVQSTFSLVEKPPGRRPPVWLRELSDWFQGLSEGEKEQIRRVAGLAAYNASFGMLAVLDGSRQISPGYREGRLELTYIEDGETILMNASDGELLHDLFQQRVAILEDNWQPV